MIFEEVDWKFKVASDKSWDIDSSEEWANDLLFWMWALQVFNYRLVNAYIVAFSKCIAPFEGTKQFHKLKAAEIL